MRRFRILVWQPSRGFHCSQWSLANAQTYYVSSNWLATYPTTTAIQRNNIATWGTGSVWSAGQMSSNFANTQIQPTYHGPGYEDLTTYYNANTGYLNSGASTVATYTYTVPFQTYQLNPGTTINLDVGQAMTEQVASGYKAMVVPRTPSLCRSALTTEGAASGLVKEVAAVEPVHNHRRSNRRNLRFRRRRLRNGVVQRW